MLIEPWIRGSRGRRGARAVVGGADLDELATAHSGVTYAAAIPPSTISDAPVMYDESSHARNSAAFAISFASPKRPSGMCTSRRYFLASVSRKQRRLVHIPL